MTRKYAADDKWTLISAPNLPDMAAAKGFIRGLQDGKYTVKHSWNDKKKGLKYSLYVCGAHVGCPARVRLKQDADTKLFRVERSQDAHSESTPVPWTRGVPANMKDAALMGIKAGRSGKVNIIFLFVWFIFYLWNLWNILWNLWGLWFL